MIITELTDNITGNVSTPRLQLLNISLDASLARVDDNSGQSIGGNLNRIKQFAQRVDALHLVVRTRPTKHRVINLTDALCLHIYPTNTTLRIGFVWRAYWLAFNICRSYSIDVITVQDPFVAGIVGYLLKLSFQIPLCIVVYGDHIDNPAFLSTDWRLPLANWFAKWLLRHANGVRVDSEQVKQQMMRLGVSEEQVYAWPVPIPDIEQRATLPGGILRQHFPSNAKIVLCVGRLVDQKDIPNLLEAVPSVHLSIPEVQFVIIGDGPLQSDLVAMTKRLGIEDQVHFWGAVPYTELPRYYVDCDVFALPSKYEGVARVLMEAAAAGKPCVATRVGGTEDVIRDGLTGLLVPSAQPASLAEALIELLRDEARAKSMGIAAREFALAELNEQALISRYIAMWQQIAASRDRRG